MPSGRELADHLAAYIDYPSHETRDLVQVSQYISVMIGTGPLYEELRKVFHANYPPTPLHTFLAQLPSALRKKGHESPYQLIVTTNYDDVLERAFHNANEPVDVVTYLADSKDNGKNGKFLHLPFGRDPIFIEKPNEYLGFPTDNNSRLRQSVILKVHGTVDRDTCERDSYVITEDHYIDYLTHGDISNLLPKALVLQLIKSHYLFLGYSLSDWNLRVFLHRIWRSRTKTYKAWAVLRDPSSVEQKAWQKRGVDFFNVQLEEYIDALARSTDTQDEATRRP